MAADRHTRLVVGLKIVLPLMALAILATLFLLADPINPDGALPYAEVDIERLAREPRMTTPTYAGTTSDGGALTLSADEARPASAPGSGSGAASHLRLRLETPDGARTDLRAAKARLDAVAGEIVLSGDVTVTTSSGYRIETAEVAARLDRSALETRAPVTAMGPAGRLSAGQMTLSRGNGNPGNYVMVFNKGVRLIYQPGG